jgi:hypothetical protein
METYPLLNLASRHEDEFRTHAAQLAKQADLRFVLSEIFN